VPFTSAIDADIRLRNPTPLSEQEIQDLMEWLPFLSTGSVRRLEAESALKQLKAIKQFDATSGKIGKLGLWLNGALFFLTVVATIIALASYSDANRTSTEQSKILKGQKDALDESTNALKSVVSVMQTQKDLLEQGVATSKSELEIIQDQNRRALEKPDVEAIFIYPQQPSVIVHNRSLSKVAQGVIYEARFWNLSKPQGDRFEFVPSRVRDVGTIRPSGSFGPFAFEFVSGQSVAAIAKGERLFGYVTVQCPECRVFRVYWMYVQFSEYGLYHEGTFNDFDFYHFGPKDENKLSEFMKSWKLPTAMPMQYP
jgi:hypothetical protein